MNPLLKLEFYLDQIKRWPTNGKHILAQFDDNSIIVYQAFNKNIAKAAVSTQNFNSDECIKNGYSLNRMSWVKTNFLWMMYRSGWATKPNQEKILAIRITLKGFEEILSKSIVSSKNDVEELNGKKSANRTDEVRLQWDPDHNPDGSKVSTGRRAIQLGLRNDMLKKFCDEFILNIYDVTDFVIEQRVKSIDTKDFSTLLLPVENVFMIKDEEILKNLL
jgi:hypothetical protein